MLIGSLLSSQLGNLKLLDWSKSQEIELSFKVYTLKTTITFFTHQLYWKLASELNAFNPYQQKHSTPVSQFTKVK
jgi:hypothetical protein